MSAIVAGRRRGRGGLAAAPERSARGPDQLSRVRVLVIDDVVVGRPLKR